MAILLLVLDGAADTADASTGCLTPLAGAIKPGLDGLAAKGRTGLITPISDSIVPQTHTGMLGLLGYDVAARRTPRGPIEVLGYLGKLPDGVLCARCNFSSLVDGRILSRRICRDISQEEAAVLVDAVMQGVVLRSGEKFQLASVSTYRLVLQIHPGSSALSDRISNTDPGYSADADVAVPERNDTFHPILCEPLTGDAAASYTAGVVNEFIERSHDLLELHDVNERRRSKRQLPANYIIARDFGIGLPEMEHIQDKYGMRSAYIYCLPIERGLAMLLGMDPVAMPVGADGETDSPALIGLISSLIPDYDLVVCHIKGPDEPGHDGDYAAKTSSIETIDKELISPLVMKLDLTRHLVVVTSDHATPWSLGTHSPDRVPVMITGANTIPDSIERFDEDSCSLGSLPIKQGIELLPFILNSI